MRIPQIQALRALAAILVVIYHAKLIGGGFVGVDIFYVISGFLITGLLIREIDKTQTLSFSNFYLRRAKRLLPSSFLVLIATGIAAWIVLPTTMRHNLGRDIAAASLYISNYLFASWQMDYQNLGALPSVVIHYWSLAVEEQFYLFWPFLIYLFYKIGGRRGILYGVCAVTITSFLFSLYQSENSPTWAFYSLPTRAWELGVGALLIFIPSRVRFAKNYVYSGLALLTYSSLFLSDRTIFPGTAAVAPVLGTALLLATINSWPAALNRFSEFRFVQWLGAISYPLYLWHWPLLVIPAISFGRTLTFLERVVFISLTLVLAGLTHRFVEEPLRNATISRRVILRTTTVATAFSLILGACIYVSSNDRLDIGLGKVQSLSQITAKPIIYHDGCHANYGEKVPATCIYGVKGAEKKIVLFGDSHAAQWFPALEKLAIENNFELISLTKSACPGPAVKKVETGQYRNSDCFAWRANAFSRIAQIRPSAVIVSGFQHFEIPKGFSDIRTWWSQGERKTYRELKSSSRSIIYISDTPQPLRDIPACLSSKKNELCNDSQPSVPIFVSGFERINPTQWLCTRICPAVIGETVVYRDASHLTMAMSMKLSEQLARELTKLGVL